ncbi:beta-tectorin isoform X1 [Solea solea]|uniref:beta-tectorin isoform X1 n=1 Tax=Solea solea TaxID=90069 RepID=UPI00272AF21E|nr:beta-tectorin isoform X1 [Solea solea]
MAFLGVLLMLLMPLAWSCPPQKADYVMVSCFPNTIIANVPECPYGWEIDQLSLGGVCYSGIHSSGYYRFIIPDLTPKNHSYCGTQSEYMSGKDPKYVFYNSIVSNDTSLTVRNQPVNYTFSCMYRAAHLVNNAVFSQSVFTKPSAFSRVATVYVNNGSLGTFRSQLSMNVFTNSKFLYTKDSPYVIDTSEIGSEVFIGIEAKGLSSRFKVVINNCWATPTPYSTDRKRWSLIINSCSSDNTVTIYENGKDSRSMFKFNSFRFQRLEKVSTVWLHCEVHVCDGERFACQPSPCFVRRSVSSEAELSGGILTTEFYFKAGKGPANNGYIQDASLFILLALLVNPCCDLLNGLIM